MTIIVNNACSQVSVMTVGNDSTEIAFASDTQAPMLIEKLVLKSNHNRRATRMLFDGIVHRHPSSLFLLGDVVSLGYSKKLWRPMDKYLDGCQKEGIPVTAALDNHELLARPKKGLSRFQSNFPNFVNTGYM